MASPQDNISFVIQAMKAGIISPDECETLIAKLVPPEGIELNEDILDKLEMPNPPTFVGVSLTKMVEEIQKEEDKKKDEKMPNLQEELNAVTIKVLQPKLNDLYFSESSPFLAYIKEKNLIQTEGSELSSPFTHSQESLYDEVCKQEVMGTFTYSDSKPLNKYEQALQDLSNMGYSEIQISKSQLQSSFTFEIRLDTYSETFGKLCKLTTIPGEGFTKTIAEKTVDKLTIDLAQLARTRLLKGQVA